MSVLKGSSIPLFRRLAEFGPLPINDERMTRFWITLPQAIRFVVDSFDRMHGGELHVPRTPSTTVIDLARAIAPDAEIDIVGIVPGEKLHEEMISEDEARRTFEYSDHDVITPLLSGWGDRNIFDSGQSAGDGFAYRSNTNDQRLDVDQIRKLIATI